MILSWSLYGILKSNYGLQPTLNVSIEESVACFCEFVGTMTFKEMLDYDLDGHKIRKIEFFLKFLERWKYFLLIMSRFQHNKNYIESLKDNIWTKDIGPYLSGFVWAMNGVHICDKVKLELQVMYLNRLDRNSFNIMEIHHLNLLFTFIWNGTSDHVKIQQFLRWRKIVILNFPFLRKWCDHGPASWWR